MKLLILLYFALTAITYVNAIFNGKNATAHSAPYIVNLRAENNSNIIECSGVIISQNAILTSMYCGNYQKFVTAGQHDVTIVESTIQKRTVDKVVKHPGNFDGNPFKPYNFAILFLHDDLIFNNNVKPIELIGMDECVSDDVIVYGWGRNTGNSYPEVLQQATLPLITRKMCNETAFKDFEISPAHLCTGSYEERSVDFQDHGGPLIQYNQIGEPYLVGIVSYPGNPPQPVGHLSVFGNVAIIRDFIDSTLENY